MSQQTEPPIGGAPMTEERLRYLFGDAVADSFIAGLERMAARIARLLADYDQWHQEYKPLVKLPAARPQPSAPGVPVRKAGYSR